MDQSFPKVPLKAMDGAMLTNELLSWSRRLSVRDADMVLSAASVSSYLHRNQTRANRGSLPRTPYSEHPLRNAVRLTRWGVLDPRTVTTALLHDVPEDCAEEVVSLYASKMPGESDTDKALSWIAAAYDPQVASDTALLTNPERPKGLSDAEWNQVYLDHVVAGVRASDSALFNKAADLMDNAGSLSHQIDPSPRAGEKGKGLAFVGKRLIKYVPAVDAVRERFEERLAEPGGAGAPGMSRAFASLGALQANLVLLQRKAVSMSAPMPRVDQLGQQRGTDAGPAF